MLTWYDQSGNGCDATATTLAPQVRGGNRQSGRLPITTATAAGST